MIIIFFNSVASITDDVNEIKLSANEQNFIQRKEALIAKVRELIGKCQTSSTYSVASVCCIWDDYFGSFLKPFLNNFANKLQRHLKDLESLEPKHQKELLDLEAQAREAENEYKENLQKANDETLSDEDREKFIVLANKAAKKAEEIKRKVKNNPIAQLASFNFLDDLRTLAGGNVPPHVSPDKNNPNNNGSNSNNGNGSIHLPSAEFLEDPQSFWEQNKKFIVLGIGLLELFFVYSQKDTEEDKDSKEDKKFLRQMMLIKAMNDSGKKSKTKKSSEDEE